MIEYRDGTDDKYSTTSAIAYILVPFGSGYYPLLLFIIVLYTGQATEMTTQNLRELHELSSSNYEVVEAFAYDGDS